jgi:hypothetical protein
VFCSKCGKGLAEDAKFCPNCAAPVGQESQPKTAPSASGAFTPPSPKPKPQTVIVKKRPGCFTRIAQGFGILIVLGIISGIVNGFGGDTGNQEPSTGNSPSTSTTSRPSASATPTQKTFVSEGCLAISEDLLESISLGMDGAPTGKAAGFVASDYRDIKFVAVEFVLDGVAGPQVAVFATNDSELSDNKLDGLILAADGFAREFSTWGDAIDTEFSIADAGAMESKDCLYLPGAALAEPVAAEAGFDESAFLKIAGEKYGMFDETYDDGSTLTVMSMTRAICDGDLTVMKSNLGANWESSFQKFAIESFCPSKLK